MTHDGGLQHAHGSDADGWTWHNVEGWEAYGVTIRADVLGGVASVVELHLAPITPQHRTAAAADRGMSRSSEPITVSRLRTLPLAELATLSVQKSQLARPALDVRTAAARLQYGKAEAQPSREAEAAVVWNDAYENGIGATPREAVKQGLHVSERTADRLIAEARRLGYITAPLRGGRAPRKSKTTVGK